MLRNASTRFQFMTGMKEGEEIMEIVGYFTRGNKEYVAFVRDEKRPWEIEVTDGFHDNKMVQNGDVSSLKKYRQVDKKDINLAKIIGRMHGTRPWHPLLNILRGA